MWMPELAPAPVRVRAYAPADASATLGVFVAAVTVTAAHDYAPEQIAAWARPGARSLGDWNRSMLARASLVAVRGGAIAGFSDVNGEGYIDMMFVAPAHARRGVASALLAAVFERARDLGATRLWANVSVTARPFFAARGFVIEAEQHPMIGGVELTNFRMSRPLPPIAAPSPRRG
jgi:putative acetyltransferase